MDPEMAELRLEKVAFRRAGQVFRFDCAVPARRICAICGPSGSGKTTLLNLIAGFETPTQGRIVMNGLDVIGLGPAKRPVSLVFQENNLFAHLDIFTNIALGISPSLKLAAGDRDRISAALARTGLGGYERRLPGTLSGGERQRAAFARALVRDRPFLLLDEPFAALDPGLRGAMAELLQELQRETGVTVLLVSHNPDEVARLADQVIFLEQGEVLADESKDRFLRHLDAPEIRAFLGKAALHP